MSLVFYQMVSLLMNFAPIGIGCYFANLTGTYGPDLLASYARGLMIYYPTMFAYFFIFLGLYSFIAAGRWGVKHFFREPVLLPLLFLCSFVPATIWACLEKSLLLWYQWARLAIWMVPAWLLYTKSFSAVPFLIIR